MSVSPSSSVPPASWRIAADAQLQLRFWDVECVLFHGASGDTHRLPDVVGRMLQALATGAATASSLSQAVDLHEEDVSAALRELRRLGILEAIE